MICNRQGVSFDTAKDIPSLEGKVIFVTGANAGLGKQTVLDLAKHKPAQIWMAARSTDKARAAADEIRKQVHECPTLTSVELDLASFESVHKAAKTFLASAPKLDMLILNAGIMATKEGLTKECYEVQWGTNHMGHALLARLLLPALQTAVSQSSSALDVRVVCVSSYGHSQVPKDGFRFDRLKNEASDLGAYGRYYQSKLGNVLWVRQMAKEHPELTVAAAHPGLVQTQLMDGSTGSPWLVRAMTRVGYGLLKTPAEGAKSQLWAAVAREVVSGEYYEPVGVHGKASDNSIDDQLAARVWNWTEGELSAWLAGRE